MDPGASDGLERSFTFPHLPGTGPVFEYGGLFISIIQYNVRIFFWCGLRRQKV